MHLSDSLNRLGTETAFSVLARAKQLEAEGRNIIHLGIGAPDFDSPEHIKEACAKALRDGHTAYCQAQGLPELRDSCARYLSRTRGIEVKGDNVVITPGAKPFLGYAVMATCNPGDEVVYPDPGFPIYESVIRYFGATPVPLPLSEDQGFAFEPSDLADRLSPATRLVILNSPANPTGGVIEPSKMAEVAQVLEGSDTWILSDEVYSEMVFDGEHASIASYGDLAERTILVDGFSKTFAMTGWRLGYAAVPEALVEPITRLIINTVSCTPPAMQLAGVAALEGPWDEVRAMVAEFERRREIVVEGLNSLPGVHCIQPKGAFYAFPNVSGTGLSDREFAHLALEQAGVAVISGTAFGANGEGFLRVSYANTVENIQAGVEALRALLVDSTAVSSA
ncbi:MAG: aspartate aminotransferase [Gaiellales bacterium]|jgi:aspartate/methionine/tyrosine aminotransferase|nr:aspartate aminotransferase [Gaiellales bacterium]